MTNREAHEEAAGMGLEDMFFRFNKINPDAEVVDQMLEDAKAFNVPGWTLENHGIVWTIPELMARFATKQIERQLPEGMEHCTIRFKECEVGHGMLTATNWVDVPCPYCKIAELESEIERQTPAIIREVFGLFEAGRSLDYVLAEAKKGKEVA